jgi:hypothetical protein
MVNIWIACAYGDAGIPRALGLLISPEPIDSSLYLEKFNFSGLFARRMRKIIDKYSYEY